MAADLYDVRRLRLLRELSLHGTIAATARVCSLTPSAVSQQLTLLEREVGSPLFIRDGRTLVLTEAARVLVDHTEGILAALEAARAGLPR
ncbi:LysR family transcriptional regulator [Prauserella oleivorans]